MGVKFGEIDSTQIIENEFRIGTLEKILDWLIANNPSIQGLSQSVIDQTKREVVEALQQKYPNSGVEFKQG